MKLIFSENAWNDYLYWQKTDKQILKRINKLIKEIQQEPFKGIGKLEPLKHDIQSTICNLQSAICNQQSSIGWLLNRHSRCHNLLANKCHQGFKHWH